MNNKWRLDYSLECPVCGQAYEATEIFYSEFECLNYEVKCKCEEDLVGGTEVGECNDEGEWINE